MNRTEIILAIIIILMTITINIEIKISYDLINNVGVVKLKLFKFLTIFKSDISLVGDYLNFSRKKSKSINIRLDINDTSIQYFNELGAYLKNKIIITKIISNSHICLENPMTCSFISSTLNSILSIIFIKLRQDNKDAEISSIVNTGFRHNILNIKLTFAFIINIYDLFWSLIRTLLIVRRRHGKKERRSREKQQNNT